MINMPSTDQMQVVTSSTDAIDVHTSFMDFDPSPSALPVPGRQNTAITTAATTQIVAPVGSGLTRNVKTISIRNKGSGENDITVRILQTATPFEIYKTTLRPGESLEYTEGIGFVQQAALPDVLANANVGDIVANAADTYLSPSALAIAGRIKAGTWFVWRFFMSKSAAGTATPLYSVRVGVNGSTADTARNTFAGVAQTAAVDIGEHKIILVVRDATASGQTQGNITMEHRLTTTGLQNQAQIQIVQSLSGTYDLTVPGTIVGVSINPGASNVWTFQHISVRAFNLA
jgi:hypothetical protein